MYRMKQFYHPQNRNLSDQASLNLGGRTQKSLSHVVKENQELHKQIKLIAEANRHLLREQLARDDGSKLLIHDLKSSVTAIYGLANHLERKLHCENEEQKIQILQLIQSSSLKMQNLIEDQLAPLPTLDQLKGQSQQFDVKEALSYSTEHFKHHLQFKNLSLTLKMPKEKIMVQGCQHYFVRAINNLISNAVKFSPMGSKVEVGLSHKNDSVLVSVTDHGPGLDGEDQKKLFKKFSKLTPKPTGKESSNGLGLYFVKQLIEKIHGKVWCESKPGKGSSFFIWLLCDQVV